MSGMQALAAALKGGVDGWVSGTGLMRSREREDKEAAFQDQKMALMTEEMARKRKDWTTTDAIESAAASTTVQERSFAAPTTGPIEESPVVTSFDTAGATFADKAAAEAAARSYNAPVATYARMSDEAQKRGKADLAKAYKDFAEHAKSNGFLALHAANAPAGITAEDIKAGRVPDADVVGLDEFNKTGAYQLPKGVRRKFIVDELGRPDYILVGQDGKQVGNFSGGQIQTIYDKATARQDRQDTISRQDKEADNKRDQRKLDITENYYTGVLDNKREAEANRLEIASMRAVAARGGQGQSGAPVWDKDADKTLLTHYTVLDPTTGAKALDGDGLQFGKQVALARARAGGGDTTMAIGYAVAKDAQIRKLAGNDPVKLQQLRAGYLASLTGQGQDAPAPKPAAPAAPPVAKPAPLPEHSLMSDIFKPTVVQAGSDTRDALTRGVLWAGKYMRQP